MHKYRRATVLPCLGICFALGMGYAATKAAPPARMLTGTPARPKPATMQMRAAMPDAELEKTIKARFAKSKIGANHFAVRVQGGVATIEGHTDVIQHKGTATRLARAAGAREVVNRVELSQAAKERAAANLAKGRRRVQVKRGEKRSERASQ